jgi:methyl-accepting chemotaxis protein
LSDGLGKLEQILLAEGGVFAAQREGLKIGAEAAALERQSASNETDYIAALDAARSTVGQRNDVAKASAERSVSQALPIIGVIVMLGIGAAIVISVISANDIVKPIRRLTGAMTQLADGAVDTAITDLDRRDEIGAMARTVEVFQVNAAERMRLEAAMQRTQDKEKLRQQSLHRHVLAFEDAITNNLEILVTEVGGLRTASHSLLRAAEQGSAEAGASATACSSAASNAQAVAVATEELDASIREIAAQANHTSSIVGEATRQTQATDREVAKLTVAVQTIDSVVTLIRTIAQQTSLLALNATIESARAGEAGRGFAVVAAEVKALSEQTAKATDEIAQQIQTVQITTDTAAAAIHVIGTQVGDIHSLTASVATAVAEQQAATADIARNVNFAATSSHQAAESSRIVIQVSQQTGAQAKSISSASDRLQAVSAAVSKAVRDFIESIASDFGERHAGDAQWNDKKTAQKAA